MSNADLFDLVDNQPFNPKDFNERYAEGLRLVDSEEKPR